MPALLNQVIPTPAGRVGEEFGISRQEQREEPHIVLMIGDDEKTEGAGQADGLPGRGDDFLATPELEGAIRSEPGPERAGIHR